MQRITVFICALLFIASQSMASVVDALGVVRVFGDTKSWMTCAFVIGDGSYVLTPYKAITENISETLDNVHSSPIFISAFTGKAYKTKLVATEKGLGVALLKLPVSGLPSSPLAELDVYGKAMYGSYGQLFQEEYVGNRWPAEAHGVTTAEIDGVRQYTIGNWSSLKVFVTDIDKYQFAFLSSISPEKPIPNGALVSKDNVVIGMNIDKLTFTGGRVNYVYTRVAMSHELIEFVTKHGVTKASLISPPTPTASGMTGGGDNFTNQLSMYALLGQGKSGDALKYADLLIADGVKNAMTYAAKGDGELANKKYDAAIAAYNEAYAFDNAMEEVYIGKSKVYMALGKSDDAENELKIGLAKLPDSSEIPSALMALHVERGDELDSALMYAQVALKNAPNSLLKRLSVAKIYKLQTEYQLAINTIGDAIKMSPDWTDGLYFLASTFEEAGDLNNAERGYKLLIQRAPNNPVYLLVWASFLNDTDRKEDAKKVIETVKTLSPTGSAFETMKELEKKING